MMRRHHEAVVASGVLGSELSILKEKTIGKTEYCRSYAKLLRVIQNSNLNDASSRIPDKSDLYLAIPPKIERNA
jgi:hypothetical protein